MTCNHRSARHGVLVQYSKYKCRCDECRAINATYHRDHRARLAQMLRNGEIEVEHGKRSTYVNFGCRCDPCRHADQSYRMRERQ